MTYDRIKLSQCIAGYITDVYRGRREIDYQLMHDSCDLKMVFLQALQCAARMDDIIISGNEWHAAETVILHLSVKGDIDGNELERATVKVGVMVCTVIDGEIKPHSLTIVCTDADYVNQYAYRSYLPAWMVVGACRVLQLIKLEIKRKPKYSFN